MPRSVQLNDARPAFEVMSNYGVPPEKVHAVKVGAKLPVKALSTEVSGVAIDWDSF